jgi:hypothetical protein
MWHACVAWRGVALQAKANVRRANNVLVMTMECLTHELTAVVALAEVARSEGRTIAEATEVGATAGCPPVRTRARHMCVLVPCRQQAAELLLIAAGHTFRLVETAPPPFLDRAVASNKRQRRLSPAVPRVRARSLLQLRVLTLHVVVVYVCAG